MEELRIEDTTAFKNFIRVAPEMFEELLQLLTPRLTKETTVMRQPLSPGLKLCITLRYLASGDNYQALMYAFRVPLTSITIVIREVCEAIIAEFASEFIKCPSTEEQWRAMADKFASRWNFHHGLGAIDAKHIAIRCPRNAGFEFYNYKGFYSIILMALFDGNYTFPWVVVGSNGSAGDYQVFKRS